VALHLSTSTFRQSKVAACRFPTTTAERSVTVVDTVGAGDSFGAALLAALVERDALEPGATRSLDDSMLEQAVEYAVTASAITCTRTRAVPPSRAKLDAWIGTSQEV
jgi:fructokinase